MYIAKVERVSYLVKGTGKACLCWVAGPCWTVTMSSYIVSAIRDGSCMDAGGGMAWRLVLPIVKDCFSGMWMMNGRSIDSTDSVSRPG